jgi:large subunit ribosomal protein L16
MLVPKKQKFRRVARNRNGLKGKAVRGSSVAFGNIGLKTEQKGELTSRQIEAARRAMTREVKRGGKIWIRIFPHKPVSRKAAEVPMGSGKGAPEYHVATVRPGAILFEMDGIEESIARKALTLAAAKLPVKCRIVLAHIR